MTQNIKFMQTPTIPTGSSFLLCQSFLSMLFIGLLLLAQPSFSEALKGDPVQLLQSADRAFERGDFANALHQYKKILQISNNAQQLPSKPFLSEPRLLNKIGQLHLAIGQLQQAKEAFTTALKLPISPEVKASIDNNLAAYYALSYQFPTALQHYNQSLSYYETSNTTQDRDQNSAQILINKTRIQLYNANYPKARQLLEKAWKHSQVLTPSEMKITLLLSMGQLYELLEQQSSCPSNTTESCQPRIVNSYQEAIKSARSIKNSQMLSYALGYLGHYYEESQNRYDQALALTREALFEAQKYLRPAALYQWQWQTARILNALGKTEQAIAAYSSTVQTLERFKHSLMAGCTLCLEGSFQEQVEPVYYALAQLYLQQSDQQDSHKLKQNSLLKVRDTLELLKTSELRDYFQDPCIDAYQGQITQLDSVSDTTSIIYIIAFEDKLEILATFPEGIKRYTQSISSSRFANQVQKFRSRLEKSKNTKQYKKFAKTLYNWLIKPIEKDLLVANIDTLVFIPDRILRSIPMSALHNGEQFLVERYAIATTLGLTLTDPKKSQSTQRKILLAGLTQAVQGFPPLVNVSSELEGIRALYDGTVLADNEYVLPKIENALEETPYSIFHIATHGVFTGDSEDSFLLTHDGKLTVDLLDSFLKNNQYRKESLELLTLSACQTAAGDDKAALGLAGFSLKAGARSALATLWSVNDLATSKVILQFYENMHLKQLSKAQALQQAQLSLIKNNELQHPFYWSAFLIIGNWL